MPDSIDDTADAWGIARSLLKLKGVASCVAAGVIFITVNVWGAATWVARRDAMRAARDKQIEDRLAGIERRLSGVWYIADEREIQHRAERQNPHYTAPSVPAVIADRVIASPSPDAR